MFTGLAEKDISILREKFGENSLPIKEGTPLLVIFLSQFKSPLIYILLFVSLISLFLQQYFDVILIGVVVFLNALMSFFQEYKAQKTLIALRQILKPTCVVIRDGQRKTIEGKDLLPGDLVIFGSGDKIPADGKLAERTSLLINEALLTGEEEAVEKTGQKDKNLLFMGTMVVFGQGIMEVIAIGQETKMGQIGQSLAQVKEEPTPLQLKLIRFTRTLAGMVVLICLTLFFIGLFYQRNL